jgi:hypothetical protein
VTAEDALRERLRVLSEASGIEAPRLDVEDDTTGRLAPARIQRWDFGEQRIVVAESLLDAGPEEQTWHLAACLGYWTSPVPRRRRRAGAAAIGVVTTAYVGLGLAQLFENVDLPTWPAFAIGTALAALLPVVIAGVLRGVQRALDEAGRGVLRRAGHDPATLTRRVFGTRPDPPWWRRLQSREPRPSRRVRAAEQSSPAVAPPLF